MSTSISKSFSTSFLVDMPNLKNNEIVGTITADYWTLCDSDYDRKKQPRRRLPLGSFNHVSREVLCLEKSREFYVDILGFEGMSICIYQPSLDIVVA